MKSGGEGAAAPLADRSREARHFSALMMMIGAFRTYTMLLAPAPPSLILCPLPSGGKKIDSRQEGKLQRRRGEQVLDRSARKTDVSRGELRSQSTCANSHKFQPCSVC